MKRATGRTRTTWLEGLAADKHSGFFVATARDKEKGFK